MSHYAIVVDLDHCTGCKGCEVACKHQNAVPLGERWNRLMLCGPYGTFPNISQYYMPVNCQQCENAPCVEVCPVGASYRDPETNKVLVDTDLCIGCQQCLPACPYSCRDWNEEKAVVEKCNLCEELTSKGELPHCVKVCSVQCRFYGDLDDPESDVSKELAKYDESCIHTLPDSGNAPLTKYIITSMHGQDAWQPDVF